MKAALAPICALAAWMALLYKMPGFRRGLRQPTLLALCASFASLALAYTLSVPQVSASVDAFLDTPNIAAFGIQASFVSYSAAAQVLLLLWAHPVEQASRRIRRRVLSLALALTTMAVLFIAAGVRERAPHFLVQHVGNPLIAAELLFYVGALTVGLLGMMRMSWRYARHSGRAWLRHGLRATAVGAGVHLGYCATRFIDIFLPRFGGDPASIEALIPLCAGIGSLLVTYGLTVPSWGPALVDVPHWVRTYQAYHRLRPLWAALYDVVPDIALDPPRSLAVDRFAVTDLAFKLYRRVIEIRDGQRALRDWYRPGLAESARSRGRAAGLAGDDLRATVEAATLAGALRARASGAPRTQPGAEEHDVPTAPTVPTGPDRDGDRDGLASEATYLVRVSRAFTASPVVARVLADESRNRQPA